MSAAPQQSQPGAFGYSSFRAIKQAEVPIVMGVLEEMRKAGGRVTPTETARQLVARSRAKGSPTHHLFEWDDTKAAEEYRIGQARAIIASISFTFESKPESPVRAFPVVTYDGKRSYESMPKVLSNKEATENLIAQARQEVLNWEKRWEHLRNVAELAPLFRAAKRLKK